MQKRNLLLIPCFAWHLYGKLGLFKTELVIVLFINLYRPSKGLRDRPIFRTVFKILTPLGFGWVGGS